MSKTSTEPIYRYMYNHHGPLSTIDSFALYKWQAAFKMILRYFFDFAAFDLVIPNPIGSGYLNNELVWYSNGSNLSDN